VTTSRSVTEPRTTSLSVLRVLDLSEGVAGAFCTKLLAGFGAEVIKVEQPGAGDPLRRHGPFPDDLPHREKGALFLYLNTGKKSITLDIAQRTGALLFRRLAEEAEVVVEGLPPGHLARLGLAYESLARIKPRLVMTSVTPFGQDGPYSGYKATNLTAFAAGGQMAVTGEPDREPLKDGGYQAEYQAGLHAFAATAVAAFSADATEVGQHIDIAAVECLATALEPWVSSWARRKRDIGWRRGNVEPAPIAFVHTVEDLLNASQLEARGFFQQIDHPAAGRQTYPGPPFRPEAMPWQAARAPLLGEHNEEIYCDELGLNRSELALLRACEVV
jgi:crotonobetainyl-CoA:carnitine CoA-transferase CaiB-like acyl-CoA transferase